MPSSERSTSPNLAPADTTPQLGSKIFAGTDVCPNTQVLGTPTGVLVLPGGDGGHANVSHMPSAVCCLCVWGEFKERVVSSVAFKGVVSGTSGAKNT